MNIDEVEGLESRTLVCGICSSWLDACKQVNKDAELRAEQRTSETRPTPLNREVTGMRAAFIATYGELEEKYTPSRSLVGSKLEE